MGLHEQLEKFTLTERSFRKMMNLLPDFVSVFRFLINTRKPTPKRRIVAKVNKRRLRIVKNDLNIGTNLTTGEQFVLPVEAGEKGSRDIILAASGGGKSYLTSVLVEEKLSANKTVVIIDPEGEYYTLTEKFQVAVIGGKHQSSVIPSNLLPVLDIEEQSIETLVDEKINETYSLLSKKLFSLFREGFSVLLDLSDYLESVQVKIYNVVSRILFEKMEVGGEETVVFVVEEAQIFAPQSGKPNPWSETLAKRGRKRGIEMIVATQRPASLNKNVLSQGTSFWFGFITAELDYKAIKQYVESAGITFDDLKALKKGGFYYYDGVETRLIRSRKRLCTHAGCTPRKKQS